MNIKILNFNIIDAKIIEPIVDASTCAKVNQEWNGNNGNFTNNDIIIIQYKLSFINNSFIYNSNI